MPIDSAPSKNCTVPVSSGALFGAQALTMYVSRTSPDVALTVALTLVVVTMGASRGGTVNGNAGEVLGAYTASPLYTPANEAVLVSKTAFVVPSYTLLVPVIPIAASATGVMFAVVVGCVRV